MGIPADWNSESVRWRPYSEALEEARVAGRPLILVLYTDWCPHCHNYSRVFHDARLVEMARRFVMVRLERDSNPEISELYDVDGEYIPRTFFLRSDGTLRRELRGTHPRFRYYLDENAADELLSLMHAALEAPL